MQVEGGSMSENSPSLSSQLFLKVKRSRAVAFENASPERVVLLSGANKKARNVCVLVDRSVQPAEVLSRACDIGLERSKDLKYLQKNEGAAGDASTTSTRALGKRKLESGAGGPNGNKMPRIVEVDTLYESQAARNNKRLPFDAEMDTALWMALTHGQFGPVLQLIEQGRDPNSRRAQSPDGASALIAACRRGDVSVVERLLALGADPEQKDNYGLTPLEHAANYPHIQQVLRLTMNDVVFDLYVVEPGQVLEGAALPTVVPNVGGGVLHLDPNTGEFLELVHDADDSDFGNNEEDSDSNEEDYYLNKLEDEDDADEEEGGFGEDMYCERCVDAEDADSREGLY